MQLARSESAEDEQAEDLPSDEDAQADGSAPVEADSPDTPTVARAAATPSPQAGTARTPAGGDSATVPLGRTGRAQHRRRGSVEPEPHARAGLEARARGTRARYPDVPPSSPSPSARAGIARSPAVTTSAARVPDGARRHRRRLPRPVRCGHCALRGGVPARGGDGVRPPRRRTPRRHWPTPARRAPATASWRATPRARRWRRGASRAARRLPSPRTGAAT